MDNIVNKQAIIDEYLLGGISYRRLSKKYGVARALEQKLNYSHENPGTGRSRRFLRVN